MVSVLVGIGIEFISLSYQSYIFGHWGRFSGETRVQFMAAWFLRVMGKP